MNAQLLNPPHDIGAMRKRCGFTLVELLVVIGIIAILISLLLPTLSRARQRAEEVKCQTTLRSMWLAAQLHMTDHQGYLPAGGWHWRPVGGIADAHGLIDDRQLRYIYYNDNGRQRPVPVTVALAISMGVRVRLDTRANLEADMQTDKVRKYFQCPSQEGQLQGKTQGSSEWVAPRDWSSYVFNEAVIGIREDYTNPDPLVGKAARIKNPAGVMYAMDGRPRNMTDNNWLMLPDSGPDQTLWDYQQVVNGGGGFGKELVDFLRHRYRANVLFMDGHVNSISLTPEGMATVGISKGIN
jgi:prepilin-type N-terminal cleavage/methylation domain-containing protein/prepilin-type processing-associated H-X9-DG protein